jgi:hypothetical protein
MAAMCGNRQAYAACAVTVHSCAGVKKVCKGPTQAVPAVRACCCAVSRFVWPRPFIRAAGLYMYCLVRRQSVPSHVCL